MFFNATWISTKLAALAKVVSALPDAAAAATPSQLVEMAMISEARYTVFTVCICQILGRKWVGADDSELRSGRRTYGRWR